MRGLNFAGKARQCEHSTCPPDTSMTFRLLPTVRIVVSGATGGCGRLAVQRLLAEGAQVRALVRDPQSREAQRLPPAASLHRGDVYDYTTLPAG